MDIYRQSFSRLARRPWVPENAKRGETDVKAEFPEVFFSSVGARGASWKALLSRVYKPQVCSVPDAKPLAIIQLPGSTLEGSIRVKLSHLLTLASRMILGSLCLSRGCFLVGSSSLSIEAEHPLFIPLIFPWIYILRNIAGARIL